MRIGSSAQGRPIEAVELDGIAPAVLVLGAIHGDEPESAELCERLVAALAQAPPRHRTVVVPVVNPDGLAAGRKNNAHHVDLNRNFAAKNWQRAHRDGYDPGPAPESEPETRALAELVTRLGPRVIVAVHQPFAVVNWDGSGRALAEEMARRSGYPVVADLGYPTPGSLGSRYGVDEKRAVVTFELPRPVPDADWPRCLDALVHATMFSF